MKITWHWLLNHLETDRTVHQISEDLGCLGSVVENTPSLRKDLDNFKVACLRELQPHPQASNLTVCQVDTGSEVIQLVCGATNLRCGMKVILARPGDIIPSTGKKLRPAVLRGIESPGMICSSEELLLPTSPLSEGLDHILEIEAHWEAETHLTHILAQQDHVLDTEITCNRGDLFSVRGLARELSLAGHGRLKPLAPLPSDSLFDNRCPIAPEALLLCPSACYLQVTESMQQKTMMKAPCCPEVSARLAAISTTSNTLSLTPLALAHYAMVDQGQPFHLFDAHKIRGTISIRLSYPGEQFYGLNGMTYTLPGGDVVTCDDGGIIALTGVLGDARTACTEDTTSILIESVFVKPEAVARTGQQLKLISEARSRFEYGADPVAPYPALRAFATNLCELVPNINLQACWGYQEMWNPSHLVYRPQALAIRTKNPPSSTYVTDLLDRMELSPQACSEGLNLTIPSWRFHDLKAEEDIVEEILRFHGYNAIQATPLQPTLCPRDTMMDRQMSASRLLASQGFFEVMTWSFISEEHAQQFSDTSDLHRTICLTSPLSPYMKVLRPSLIPSLLTVASRHERHTLPLSPLFEVASHYTTSHNLSAVDPSIHLSHTSSASPATQETQVIAGLIPLRSPLSWRKTPLRSYLDAKAALVSLAQHQGFMSDNLNVASTSPRWYHPQRSGSLMKGKVTLGVFGQVAASVLNTYHLKEPYAAFEAFIHRWPLPKKTQPSSPITLSLYPISTRDIAFNVPQELASEAVLRCLQKASSSLVIGLCLFDVYDGLTQDASATFRKSLAFRVRLQSDHTTLSDEMITTEMTTLIHAVTQTFDAYVREP